MPRQPGSRTCFGRSTEPLRSKLETPQLPADAAACGLRAQSRPPAQHAPPVDAWDSDSADDDDDPRAAAHFAGTANRDAGSVSSLSLSYLSSAQPPVVVHTSRPAHTDAPSPPQLRASWEGPAAAPTPSTAAGPHSGSPAPVCFTFQSDRDVQGARRGFSEGGGGGGGGGGNGAALTSSPLPPPLPTTSFDGAAFASAEREIDDRIEQINDIAVALRERESKDNDRIHGLEAALAILSTQSAAMDKEMKLAAEEREAAGRSLAHHHAAPAAAALPHQAPPSAVRAADPLTSAFASYISTSAEKRGSMPSASSLAAPSSRQPSSSLPPHRLRLASTSVAAAAAVAASPSFPLPPSTSTSPRRLQRQARQTRSSSLKRRQQQQPSPIASTRRPVAVSRASVSRSRSPAVSSARAVKTAAHRAAGYAAAAGQHPTPSAMSTSPPFRRQTQTVSEAGETMAAAAAAAAAAEAYTPPPPLTPASPPTLAFEDRLRAAAVDFSPDVASAAAAGGRSLAAPPQQQQQASKTWERVDPALYPMREGSRSPMIVSGSPVAAAVLPPAAEPRAAKVVRRPLGEVSQVTVVGECVRPALRGTARVDASPGERSDGAASWNPVDTLRRSAAAAAAAGEGDVLRDREHFVRRTPRARRTKGGGGGGGDGGARRTRCGSCEVAVLADSEVEGEPPGPAAYRPSREKVRHRSPSYKFSTQDRRCSPGMKLYNGSPIGV